MQSQCYEDAKFRCQTSSGVQFSGRSDSSSATALVAHCKMPVSEVIIPMAGNRHLGPFPAVPPVIRCHLLVVTLLKTALEGVSFHSNTLGRKLACSVLGLSA